MISDEERQKLIVRQSSLKVASELLISSYEGVEIPLKVLYEESEKIEAYVFSVLKKKVDKTFNKDGEIVPMSPKEGDLGIAKSPVETFANNEIEL